MPPCRSGPRRWPRCCRRAERADPASRRARCAGRHGGGASDAPVQCRASRPCIAPTPGRRSALAPPATGTAAAAGAPAQPAAGQQPVRAAGARKPPPAS
ncbi:MAG: hypothetical protein MZW92_18335 [Comamonadaceae bacterium]|nr:hypothetical protein [Comamonadaceae bacterium]